MGKFISCDWGTSAFRLRLVRKDDLGIIDEIRSLNGIAVTNAQWVKQQEGGVVRTEFFADLLINQLNLLSEKTGLSLDGIPVVLSGMASSSIGLLELPYKKLPFNLDGSDLFVEVLNANGSNPLLIISGARTINDVMRGEETKVLGCAAANGSSNGRQLLILPGTHPKHITVAHNQAIDIQSFMTGEFFDLLSVSSVLSASVQKGGDFKDPLNQIRFHEGVSTSVAGNLLNAAFRVRTNQLLKQIPATENFYYLSGLLIGTELKSISTDVQQVCLVGGAIHLDLYTKALEAIGVKVASSEDADLALIRGQRVVFERYYS